MIDYASCNKSWEFGETTFVRRQEQMSILGKNISWELNQEGET